MGENILLLIHYFFFNICWNYNSSPKIISLFFLILDENEKILIGLFDMVTNVHIRGPANDFIKIDENERYNSI